MRAQAFDFRTKAGTLLLAVAMAGGAARIEGLIPAHLTSVLGALETVGVSLETSADSVTIIANHRPHPAHITALPYPGIPTDLQAQWMALLSLANGTSIVQDQVFPHRMMHIAELRRFGAQIDVSNSYSTIKGIRRLSGARVAATDLRAGAALVLAGLSARGETIVHGIEHLDRGYEHLETKLKELGARIGRVYSGKVTQLTT